VAQVSLTLPPSSLAGANAASAKVSAVAEQIGQVGVGTSFPMTLQEFIAITLVSSAVATRIRAERSEPVTISDYQSSGSTLSYKFHNTGSDMEEVIDGTGNNVKVYIDNTLSFNVTVNSAAGGKTTTISSIVGVKVGVTISTPLGSVDVKKNVTKATLNESSGLLEIDYS
jgi:hypothetical protein